MEKKDDFDFDIKLVKMHEPASDFASKVTSEALNQLRTDKETLPWIIWVPRICIGGFSLVLLTLGFFVIQYFSNELITENFILGLKAIFIVGAGLFLYRILDRFMRRIVLGYGQ